MPDRQLSRSTSDRKIAGVAGGVARYFDVDPNLVRIAWVLSVLLAGAGVLLYAILWIVLPEEPDGISIAGGRRSPALAIAEERYARGEITADELREIRATLSESA
ncbi:MAG TPA: PspC domain-containing protein [Actinomycetota bacterium]|nr:PspC domain-containing protein [Actinomycetota bacterium]